MSNAEKTRAPKASEALRAVDDELSRHYTALGRPRMILGQHIAAAERAEAEAEERDGESVEALMRECASLVKKPDGFFQLAVCESGNFEAAHDFAYDEHYLYGSGADPIAALKDARDKLRAASSPSAPDYEKMGWEELEALLPRGADIMVGASCYVVVVGGRPRGKGKTRIAAVRAYLREHGGGAA